MVPLIHDGYFSLLPRQHTQHLALAGDSRRAVQEIRRKYGHGDAAPVASNGEASLNGETRLSHETRRWNLSCVRALIQQ